MLPLVLTLHFKHHRPFNFSIKIVIGLIARLKLLRDSTSYFFHSSQTKVRAALCPPGSRQMKVASGKFDAVTNLSI
jgi:hypothetical protein